MPPVGAIPESMSVVKRAKDMPNRVADMFTGRTVLVTGGTGFLGKVLVEKILRLCPGVKSVLILVRPKKGKLPKTRIDDILQCPLFNRLRSEQPDVSKRLEAITGDVGQEDLGLSSSDRERIINEVSMVFHCAANIRFDASLKEAVLMNTRGTRSMLQLSQQMDKIEAFVHVSTSYCHLDQKVLLEKPYPPPGDPNKIIKCMELLDISVVDSMTKSILGSLPNTYAFTKALSEGLVEDYMEKVPAIILRPSIVIPVWKDPLPGWTDNLNGPMGLLIGAGKGVIRTMYCDSKGCADFVPVDITVNAMLMATWEYVTNKPANPENRVYNITSSQEHQISWEEIIEIGRVASQKIPFNGIVWYPGGSMKRSRTLHLICAFLFHTLPAYFLDSIILLSGNKPVLRRVQQRITKGFEVFEYYANNQWEFRNDKVLKLRSLQNEREYDELLIDGKGMDLTDYFEKCIMAARLYLLGETPDTLPAARRHLRVMYYVDRVTRALLMMLLVWLFFSVASPSFDTLRYGIEEMGRLFFGIFPSGSKALPS